ncbi:MAG: glycoside hydrolase family 43 protein [Clostridia bacterium]|nr:glycoside hydrolase family 43 protein [Clostridia bacterium]
MKRWVCFLKYPALILLAFVLAVCPCGCVESGQPGNVDGAGTDKPEDVAGTSSPADGEGEDRVTGQFTNPISVDSKPDPFIVWHDGYYYALATEVTRVRLYRSKTLENVFKGEYKDLIKTGDDIGSGKTLGWNAWAPELHFIETTGRWYVYFCACTDGFEFGSMRMLCLESNSDDPFSDYTFKGAVDDSLLAIDMTVYYDKETGNLYACYSQFSDYGQILRLGLMENPWTLGTKTRTRISIPQLEWETRGTDEANDGRVNEGPIFVENKGELYIIYSASGCWSEYYCLGALHFIGTDRTPQSFQSPKNWEKLENPIFESGNEVYGVGHCSFFDSPDGSETWIAYHGMAAPDAGVEGRYAYVQKIDFDENGLPVIGKPVSRDTVLTEPSGEDTTAD